MDYFESMTRGWTFNLYVEQKIRSKNEQWLYDTREIRILDDAAGDIWKPARCLISWISEMLTSAPLTWAFHSFKILFPQTNFLGDAWPNYRGPWVNLSSWFRPTGFEAYWVRQNCRQIEFGGDLTRICLSLHEFLTSGLTITKNEPNLKSEHNTASWLTKIPNMW